MVVLDELTRLLCY